jgi:hypothetical protein
MPHVVTRLERGRARSNLAAFGMRLCVRCGCDGEWGKCNGNGYDNKLRTVHEETGLVLVSKHLQKHSHKGSNFDLLVIAAKVTAEEFALKRKISSTAYRK